MLQSCDDILEPKLEQLISQLREIGGLLDNWLTDHLTSRLSSLSSPDDLFNFFNDMRGQFFFFNYFIIFLSFAVVKFYLCFFVGILGGPDSGVMEDDQLILDPNSNLGMFLRRCILAFNLLTFEVFLSCLISCKYHVLNCDSMLFFWNNHFICLLCLRYT